MNLAPIELDTPRLQLRRWRDSDRAPFAELNQDPRVMEHFPAPIPRERSDASIDAFMASFAERGWSNWAVERRDTGEFPLRTATKLVVPIDNPNGSYIKRIPSSIAVGGQG